MAQNLDYNLIDGEFVFNSAQSSYITSEMLDPTHVIISYTDDGNGGRGTSIIGTIAGDTLTWGSEYIFNNGSTFYGSMALLDSTHVVISYRDSGNSHVGTSIIGTISNDDEITWGSEVVFSSGGSANFNSVVVLDSTHFMTSFLDGGNSSYGTSIIGTVSNGDTITFGSKYVFNSASSAQISAVLLDTNKVCISYYGASGRSIIATIDGTVITYASSSYLFNVGVSYAMSTAVVDPTHIMISYMDGNNSNKGTSIIGTIDGDVITFGNKYIFNDADSQHISSVLLDSTHVCVSYRDGGNFDYGIAVIGTIDGNTITFGDEYIFNSGGTYYTSLAMLDSTHVLTSYRDTGNAEYGTSIIGTYDSGEIIIPEDPYIRPDNITGLYNLSSIKGNLRGKASEGWVRPTICQYFTSKNFEEIESSLERAHIMAGRSGADNIQYTPDTWVIKTSLPFIGGRDQRYGQSGTVINNKGYIFSGSNGVTNWTTVHEYTLNLDTWATKTSIPSPARVYSASTTILDKGYVFGGYTNTVIADNDEYFLDGWASRTNVPTSIYHCTSTTILDKGYVFGSFPARQSNYEYIFDTWTTRTNLPLPGRDSAVSTTALDKGYIFGGQNGPTKYADNDEYTPNTWTSKTDVPTPSRAWAASTTINNKCYLVGGLADSGNLADNDEYVLDTWTAMADSTAGANRLQTGMTLIG